MSRLAQRSRPSRAAPTVISIRCLTCAAETPSTAQFCAVCGSPLDAKVARRQWLILLVLIVIVGVVVFAAHWPALSAKAISFDDTMYLTDNPLVRNPSWASAKQFLVEVLQPSTVAGYYQPLAMISLMLDYISAGSPENLEPFHRTSLILHVLNTALVIVLLHMLFGQPWIAALVGLLFGVHPLTVESIPWVGERKTLLAAFFGLWSIIFYVRYTRTSGWVAYIACLLAYILALLSKPTSTMLPLVFLLMDFWPLGRLRGVGRAGSASPNSRESPDEQSRSHSISTAGTGRRNLPTLRASSPSSATSTNQAPGFRFFDFSIFRLFLEKTPFFLVCVVSAWITYESQRRTASVTDPGEQSTFDLLLILCHNIIFYPYKMLWPTNLTSHHLMPKPIMLAAPAMLIGLIGTLILLPLLIWSLRRTRALLTGWLIFFVAIFPTMGVIGFTMVIASYKYAYLPVIGFLMVLAWALGLLFRPDALGRIAPAKLTVVGIVAMLATVLEIKATRGFLDLWQDTEKLYQHMIALTPKSAILHSHLAHHLGNVANELRAQGDEARALQKYDEAIRECEEAIRDDDKCFFAYNNWGSVLADLGRFQEAADKFTLALRLRDDYPMAYKNLALAMVKLAQSAQTREQNLQGLREAEQQYRRALQYQPLYPEAHCELGNALAWQQRFEEALAEYRIALEQNPSSADACNNVANVLNDMHRGAEAVEYLQRALQIDPTHVRAEITLGRTLRDLGRRDQAIAHFRAAARLDPPVGSLHALLGMDFEEVGLLDDAIAQYERALQLEPNMFQARMALEAAKQRRQQG